MASAAFIARDRNPAVAPATLPFRPVAVQPSAVRLYTHADCVRWFLPQGHEHVAGLISAGEYHPDPEHVARIWARFCGSDAWRNPRLGAAMAVGFLARCVAALLNSSAQEIA